MKKGKLIITTILYSLFVWLFLCVDMGNIFPNVYAQENAGIIVKIITELQRVVAGLGVFSLLKELAFAAILYVSYKLIKNRKPLHPVYVLLAGLFSALYITGESFKDTDSFAYIVADPLVFIISLLRFFGLFFVLCHSIGYAVAFLDSGRVKPLDNFRWSYIKVLLLLALFWIPCLIVMYPGGYGLDVQLYLRQYFGYEALSNAHPPFTTFLTGACVRLGNLMENPTLGLFICTLIQFMFMLLTTAYGIWFVIKRVKNRALAWIMILWAGMSFMFVFHASNLGKDAQYSACLVMMAVSILRMREHLKLNDVNGCLVPMMNYVLFSLLGCLLRHNGLYVCIPCTVGIMCLLLSKKIKAVKTVLYTLLSLVGVLLFLLADKVVYPAVGVEENSDSLLYVTELQHTAKIMLEYPDEVSPEDREIIGKLMDVDRVAERYNPKTSDGIKAICDLHASPDDIREYKKVWRKEIKAHPGVLFTASYNIAYGFFAPVDENMAMDFGDWYYESEWPEIDFRLPTFITGFRYLYEMVLNIVDRLPLVRLLQNPGLYTWLFGFMFVYTLMKREFELVPAYIPGLVTFAFYIVLPSYYGHPRYAFPVVYSMFIYVGFALLFTKEMMKKDKESG